jgi:hypothetical protein
LAKIAENKALSILNAARKWATARLPKDYDAIADGGDDDSPAPEQDVQRLQILEEVIENELRGLEKSVARHLMANFGTVDYKQLQAETHAKLDTLYSTCAKVRRKIRERAEEIERQRKGSHEL